MIHCQCMLGDIMTEVSAVEVLKPSFDGQDGIVTELNEEVHLQSLQSSDDASPMIPKVVPKEDNANDEVRMLGQLTSDIQSDIKEKCSSSESNLSDNANSMVELEKVKKEMKMMETALLGVARQSQVKTVGL
ncbi:hypothetical protein L6452_17294 [Arctium lappa]|uniref:Uncharacterized protein n=1 Tax=Arctium lappa TaxID=4217 RepID=A0ACB9C362_ARCLA|nr:hypothetical protein L6452_17294 [Arctium lappa]